MLTQHNECCVINTVETPVLFEICKCSDFSCLVEWPEEWFGITVLNLTDKEAQCETLQPLTMGEM